MGVWGKGYGGFATTMILAQDIGLFHCGIALAPITSWAHYGESFISLYITFIYITVLTLVMRKTLSTTKNNK